MNIYLVVEGFCEREVYPKWAKYLNPRLKVVQYIDEVEENHIYIVSGGGYPGYYEIIENAISDVCENDKFDKLVIAIDSEKMTYEDKKDEIELLIKNIGAAINYEIIVQHFCIETWALGNRAIVNRHSANSKVLQYREIHDVLTKDPAEMPDHPAESLNRAQFAERYLRTLLNDKYRNLTYNKRNPKPLLNRKYFDRVVSRFTETGHIASFEDFLNAFQIASPK